MRILSAALKRSILRAFYRLAFQIAYFFSPEWAFNAFLQTIPSELLPEILTRFGAQIGKDTSILSPLRIHNMGKDKSSHFSNLNIGNHCYLGPDLFLDLSEQVIIEDRTTISMRVSLITHMDVGQSPLRDQQFPPRRSGIRIRHGAYLGIGVIVLMGVEIGESAVIGAGSVINMNIPPGSVAVGGTTRIVRNLEQEKLIES